MLYKKFFTALVAMIMFVSSTCAAEEKIIDAENVVPEIGLLQNVTYAQYFT